MTEAIIRRFSKSIAERKRDEIIDMKECKNRSDIEFIAMMADIDIFDDEEVEEVEEDEA